MTRSGTRILLLPVLLTGSSALAEVAKNLASFEADEDPKVKYIVATDKIEKDDFANITDVGDGVVRFTLRFNKDWWDGDQSTERKDRQRAEVKGLGPHQKTGETFEYGVTFRTDPDFTGTDKWTHVFQLKATDGDNGPPLVTLTLHQGTHAAAVQFWSGDAKGFSVARKFTWKGPGEWQTVKIRIKTSTEKDGEILASVDGDEFQGVKDIAVYRPKATDYRPKWGFYRGISKEVPMHDDWVEQKNASAEKISPATEPQKQ